MQESGGPESLRQVGLGGCVRLHNDGNYNNSGAWLPHFASFYVLVCTGSETMDIISYDSAHITVHIHKRMFTDRYSSICVHVWQPFKKPCKTFSIRVTSADIDMCLCRSGEGGEGAAKDSQKGLNTINTT